MDRLWVVADDESVIGQRAVWRAQQHHQRWSEFPNESRYNAYRDEVRRELFKTEWLPQVSELNGATLGNMPTGLLADLYPDVLRYGPQADAWQAWNRQLALIFAGMNASAGHVRQNFINSFIAFYGSRIRNIDPGAETLVFEAYRDTYETAVAHARVHLQPTEFVSRTLPSMKPNTWDRFLRAYQCGSELILLGDLLPESNKRWAQSLRMHRSFMRKARQAAGVGK